MQEPLGYGRTRRQVSVAANGNVTVKKKCKKGIYKVTVRVTAAGDSNYNAAYKDVTIKIRVK